MDAAAPSEDLLPYASRTIWLSYAGLTFRIVASYRGAPAWGWLAEIAQTDAEGNDVPSGVAEWQFEQSGTEGLRTPHDSLAAAVRAVTEVVDRSGGAASGVM